MRVSVIGGGGHVGLAMGLVTADAGHDVRLIDKQTDVLDKIKGGKLPYREPGGSDILDDAIEADRIETSEELAGIGNSDIVTVVVGTPIDEHNNPQMENFLQVIDDVIDRLREGQLVVLRSTIYPGTTAIVREKFEAAGFEVGQDVGLVFAPERVAQHKAIDEMRTLPQLVGAFDDASFEGARDFFDTFLETECLRLTPTEAEIGKLFTNMWRYVTFAVANEFHLITDYFADQHDVNIHRILEQTSQDYPRFNVPSPGANVGGPCLTKDGWFLIDDIPYNEMVSTAFQINEGMPAQILQRMRLMAPDPEKVTVLGMSFKRNSDDIRNSVSIKMKKLLERKGYRNVACVDPHCDEFADLDAVADSDWVVVMTPHSAFEDLDAVSERVNNPDCLYCDIWGHWDEMRLESDNGYFYDYEREKTTNP